MSIKMSKGKLFLFLLALGLSNFIVMNDYIIVPVAANLFEAFPTQTGMVNFILSGPQIFGVVAALICGRMLSKVSKKTILVVTFGIFVVVGIFGVAVETALYMAVMRAIMGACMGFVNTAAVALLAEVFIDEKQRSTYMGIFNAAQAGVGAVMSYAAGMLALTSWQSVYKVYYASVPILILFILFLPKTAAEGEQVEDKTAVKEKLPGKYYVFVASLFVFVLDYMVLSFMISVYIAEHNIGDASLAGLCTSLSTILSATMCALFGFSYSKLKRWVAVPSWIIFAVFYLLMWAFPSRTMAMVASALMGGAFGNAFSYYYMDGTVIVPESQVSNSMGIITAVQGLAMGLATYFATFLMGILKTEMITPIFPILAIIAAVGTVYSIYVAIKWKN